MVIYPPNKQTMQSPPKTGKFILGLPVSYYCSFSLIHQIVLQVNKIIVDNGAENRVVWGSFNHETTELCHKTNRNIGLIFSMVQVVKLYLCFYLGLLAFMDLKETHLELPMPSIFFNEKFRSGENNLNISSYNNVNISSN